MREERPAPCPWANPVSEAVPASAAALETVVVVHNYYQQAGGEDAVFQAETSLLTDHGHQIVPYTVHNDRIGRTAGLRTAARTVWNPTTYRELRALFRRYQPAVAHFHNTFPLVSPSAYRAARAEGVPVVQTLHNFRLCCPNALFYRDGRPCEDCLTATIPWPGVVHACYRGSRAATGVVAAMLTAHRALGTYKRDVDAFIALSRFARDKFVTAGLPADRIVVKPNFLAPDPGVGLHQEQFGLFVGRLSSEKGVATLLEAWRTLGGGALLRVVGQGPEEHLLTVDRPGVEWLGWQPREQVLDLMKRAAFLILPSECYENFPLTLVEAYATGLPVVASAIGSLGELVEDFGTGRHFRPGDAGDLAAVLTWMRTHPSEAAAQGRRARQVFEQHYTAERNYAALLDVYRFASEHGRRLG
jgi:glycosyltransferase involved in cell wall biosynthesis